MHIPKPIKIGGTTFAAIETPPNPWRPVGAADVSS
jgi:hypothetical protein